jgi:putative ABC transport system permease protein
MLSSWKRLSGLLMMVRRSLAEHALSTIITLLSVALASGLVMAVFCVNDQAYEAFTGEPLGFDAVLGARGSPLQLVLNTVFHLETSPGNIPWHLYQEMKQDPRVSLAIPYAVGDNYQGFRIVGTTEEIFTRFEYQKGRRLEPRSGGRVFDAHRREAVIGSTVAQKTGLKEGMTFSPYHGLSFDPGQRHQEEYLVVGVTEPSNSPSDRVVWIPLEGIFRMEGHVLRGTGEEFHAEGSHDIEDKHKEVSAVMLKFKNPQSAFAFNRSINLLGKDATLAWPLGTVMAEFFDKIGWVNKILGLVAYLVVAVAAGSILASIYNTMNERRRDFAILRALGARRRTVFSVILLESATIATLGSVVGYLVYAAIALAAAVVVKHQTGVVIDPLRYHPSLAWTPAGMIVLGALSGVVPALKAYSTDVASNLVAAS